MSRYFGSPPISGTERALETGGFWNDIVTPKAFTYNGVTYFTSVNDSGDIHISSYNHTTHATTTPYLIGSGFVSVSGDVHNSAAVIVRQSDHKILIVECSEDATQFFRAVSTNAEDATAFPVPTTILTGGGGYTYPQLCQLSGESGKVYLWCTNLVSGVRYLAYSTSTDGGATWSALTNVISPVASDRTYRVIGSNYVDRIDIFTTNTDRTTTYPSSVYHLYMQGGNFYQSDGTQITASLPFVASAGTLVQDTTYGRARPEGWAYDGTGKPACVINSRDLTGNTPPEYVRVGRFDGSSWTTHAVASSGQLISASAMVKADPNTVYMPRLIGSALELFEYTSLDEGVTWTGAQLTSGSTDDNDAPDTPIDASALKVLWGYGIYTGPSFSFDVKGWT